MQTFRAGFTLVELLVVAAIVLVISALVLVGHFGFRGSILLSNITYEIALSIREAQVFGLGAREATLAGSDFDTGYGIHFDRNTPGEYVLFADLDRNFVFDEDAELVRTYTLRQSYSISRFCGQLSSVGEICSNAALQYINIMFDRPEPDAIIRGSIPGHQYIGARIEVSSPQGTTRVIEVTSTGQIAVEDATL